MDLDCDFSAFKNVVRSRRSIRVFTEEVIPDSVVEECLELALLAPNSSNLQTWQFVWVQSPEKLKILQEYCFNQPAAKTAKTLIVAVARPDFWKRSRELHLKSFEGKKIPQGLIDYYQKLLPQVYENGPFGIFAPFKTLAVWFRGFRKVTHRGPFGRMANEMWATKTTALACQNLMLSFRAAGYDTCPMEGFDEVRVKSLLDLPAEARVVMVISAGRRSEQGVYGEQTRFEKSLFIQKV